MMPRPASDKRDRLVAAAAERFHARGFHATSLADVAKQSGVPLGNVFYYFKTKNELAGAVVDVWVDRLESHMASFEVVEDRWCRLNDFVGHAVVLKDMYVSLGCPLAGLTHDLRQAAQDMHVDIARVYAVQFDWLITQFGELGFSPDEATAHSRFLMGGLHGAILLAHAQGDPGLISSGVEGLKGWLAYLRETAAGAGRSPAPSGG